MKLPYRTRRTLSRVGLTVLVVALVALMIWACWLLWLKRFVVYTQDGAKLDFGLSAIPQGEVAVPPAADDAPPLYFITPEDAQANSTELTRLSGYYVDIDALKDIDGVKAQLAKLEPGSAVMVDVKSIYGNFLYSSEVSANRSSAVKPEAMDALLTYLKSSKLYTIARLPALRDYSYGLHHVSDGLAVKSGAYLWMDDDGCYWLNPASQGTISFLVQQAQELKELGFDEVVFTDFRFPDTENLAFRGDKSKTLTTAAQTLVTTCATDRFAVSFVSTGAFTPPKGRTRIYWENAQAYQAADVAAASGVENTEIGIVFLTEVHDTRFDVFSVLRPLDAAH